MLSWKSPSPLLGGDFDVLYAPNLILLTAALAAAPWGLNRHGKLPWEARWVCQRAGCIFSISRGISRTDVALKSGLHGVLQEAEDSQVFLLW